MIMNTVRLGTMNHCAGDDKQQIALRIWLSRLLQVSCGGSWLALRNLHCHSRYLATTSEDRTHTEDSVCAVVAVMYTVY
jgi:hypothetical protein